MIKKISRKIRSYLRLDTLIKEINVQNRVNMLNYSVLNNNNLGITEERYTDKDIIVSLTTYGKRLNQVYLTIESLMQQSLKPNKIVLWLDKNYQKKRLPQLLNNQINRGLEIKYCDDVRSYTKLVPALQEYPNDVIITVDDDLYYDINVLENLVSAYLQDMSLIYYNRGHKIRLQKNGGIAPYRKWSWNMTSLDVSVLNFPTGVGGVLYPPNSFNQEVFNQEVFLNICPFADDVWFKAMALFNDKLSKKVETISILGEEYLENISVQDIALHHQNIGQRKNDLQVKAVFEKYNLLDKLR
jgi:hypothetical protein